MDLIFILSEEITRTWWRELNVYKAVQIILLTGRYVLPHGYTRKHSTLYPETVSCY